MGLTDRGECHVLQNKLGSAPLKNTQQNLEVQNAILQIYIIAMLTNRA